MLIDRVAKLALKRVIGRAIRIVALTVVMTYFVVVAIYYFGAAVLEALSSNYGLVNAQLIVGGIYLALAVICFIILWVTSIRSRRRVIMSDLSGLSRQALILMLVEALILGYELARKRGRKSLT